jgi:hypothetical protein
MNGPECDNDSTVCDCLLASDVTCQCNDLSKKPVHETISRTQTLKDNMNVLYTREYPALLHNFASKKKVIEGM